MAVALRMAAYFALRPWLLPEAMFLYERSRKLFPEFRRGEYVRGGKMADCTVLFSPAVWKY